MPFLPGDTMETDAQGRPVLVHHQSQGVPIYGPGGWTPFALGTAGGTYGAPGMGNQAGALPASGPWRFGDFNAQGDDGRLGRTRPS